MNAKKWFVSVWFVSNSHYSEPQFTTYIVEKHPILWHQEWQEMLNRNNAQGSGQQKGSMLFYAEIPKGIV